MMGDTAFCFDLDGTVTTTEILPCIASELGIAEEMAVLTRSTMDGHIPFESSFRLRCLLLGQIATEKVRQLVADVPLDAGIFSFIRERAQDCYIVTGNLDIWISSLVEKLGCSVFSSKGVYQDGLLRVTHVFNKSDAIDRLRFRGYRRIVAVGDGANDAGMLSAACVGIAFGGVHAPALSAITAADAIVYESSTLCRLLKTL
ncbi:MAG: HAD-IB family phosphatase [Rhodocyclaceae bacterium]|nr:HAD-IB family phosphatase [Rhodocyclaceae bacterium]